MRDLGARLVALSSAQLQSLPLPDELREAVNTAQNLRQHGAHRRQLQYIGKLMRRLDAEPIRAALDDLDAGRNAATRLHHVVEQLCAALLSGHTQAFDDFFARYPTASRQELQRLLQDAAREAATQQPPRARRILFRWLRSVVTANTDLSDAAANLSQAVPTNPAPGSDR